MIWLLFFIFIAVLIFLPKKIELFTQKGTEWDLYIHILFRIRLAHASIGIGERLPYLRLKILNRRCDSDIKSIFGKKHRKRRLPRGIIKSFKPKKLICRFYTGEADSTALICGVIHSVLHCVFTRNNSEITPVFGSEKPFIYLRCIFRVCPGKILIELIKNKRRNKNASNRKHTSNHNVTA